MGQDSNSLVRLHTYECVDCGRRVKSAYNPNTCEDCGGDMSLLSRSKE